MLVLGDRGGRHRARGASMSTASATACTSSPTASPIDALTITAAGEVETIDTGGMRRRSRRDGQPAGSSCAARRSRDPRRRSTRSPTACRQAARSTGCTICWRRSPRASPTTPTRPHAGTSAAEAFEAGQGRLPGPRPHLHRRRAPARHPGPLRHRLPARRGRGERRSPTMPGRRPASPDLGWVGFDPANHICPTERYVRLACGFDAASAAPDHRHAARRRRGIADG